MSYRLTQIAARVFASRAVLTVATLAGLAALAVYADEIEAALTGVSTAWRTGPVVHTTPAEFAAFGSPAPSVSPEAAAAAQARRRARRAADDQAEHDAEIAARAARVGRIAGH